MVVKEDTPILFVFDFDSTLIEQETIDELANLNNRYEECAKITKRAMNGELNFEQSFRARIKLLEGLDANFAWNMIKDNLQFNLGVKQLFRFIRSRSPKNKIFIVSSGFIQVVEYAANLLQADGSFANYLQVDDNNRFTGELETGREFIDAEYKRKIIQTQSKEFPVSVAVGDGSNDILMFKEATISIATYDAKPIAKQAALFSAPERSLYSILSLIYDID